MSEEMCYVGVEPCGCRVAVIVDQPHNKTKVAKEIASWIKDGLTVERVNVSDARRLVRRCLHQDVQPGLFK